MCSKHRAKKFCASLNRKRFFQTNYWLIMNLHITPQSPNLLRNTLRLRSRRTCSDFQTPRRVEIERRTQAFLTNFEVFNFKIRGSPIYEYLNVLFKLSPTSRENRREIWLNLGDFFLRFPNIVHAVKIY